MFSKITALYVEDEEAIRDAISTILPKLFKNFIVAVNGEEGLDKFISNQNDIDVIITDINMPKLNGLDMLEKIKDINPTLPMLITSAHNDLNFLHRAIDIGVTGYINKPIDLRQLIEIVKKNVVPIIEKKELEIKLKIQQEKELKSAKFLAIGQLSAGITHEINTPLTYIKGTLEIMQYDIDDLEDGEIKNNLLDGSKTIGDGIKRMENIISSMKEMASATSNKMEQINIYHTLRTAITMTYNKSKHISNIYINGNKFDINNIKDQEDDFICRVQTQRIEQVWVIIINNAMDELYKKNDFSNNRLDILVKKDDKKIIIKFKDNAGGIDSSIKDSLFEAFKSTKESSGIGVGLSLAKKIILEHDGQIEAYNEDDGAVFEIKLFTN